MEKYPTKIYDIYFFVQVDFFTTNINSLSLYFLIFFVMFGIDVWSMTNGPPYDPSVLRHSPQHQHPTKLPKRSPAIGAPSVTLSIAASAVEAQTNELPVFTGFLPSGTANCWCFTVVLPSAPRTACVLQWFFRRPRELPVFHGGSSFGSYELPVA